MVDYKQRLLKNLKFKSSIKYYGNQIFDSIAEKLKLKRKEITFIGIHNRRGEEYRQWMKKSLKKNPFKKTYFYDAMEEMRYNNFNEQTLRTRNVKLISVFNFRESYKNVSFLYFSDDMDWARKNLKDKHHDLVITFVKMI